MTVFQPPKPLDQMTPEELELWEDMIETSEDLRSLDVWDDLETLRELLNNSQLEAMHFLKKQSKYGRACPYYLKAKVLFDRDSRARILSLLEEIQQKLKTEDGDS
jgi:hypothetical protein